jgi:hypothetical protein
MPAAEDPGLVMATQIVEAYIAEQVALDSRLDDMSDAVERDMRVAGAQEILDRLRRNIGR